MRRRFLRKSPRTRVSKHLNLIMNPTNSLGLIPLIFSKIAVISVVLLGFGASTSQAFLPGIHMDITTDALSTISVNIGTETVRFTDRALLEVALGNFFTDVGPGFFVGANHFTEEMFAASSARLILLRAKVIALVTSDRPDGIAARAELGGALHTLQDFYAHANWVELGRSQINSALGRSILPNPDTNIVTCPTSPETLPPGGGPILTTGYYVGLLGCGPIPVPGKCYHGGPGGCDGIHKDDPSRSFHAEARDLATRATLDYLDQILSDPLISGNANAIKCLLGVLDGTLGIVIDDTGSMGEEIDSVKAEVRRIVSDFSDEEIQPKEFLLVRFGDPDVGPPFATMDPVEFLSRVDSLSASGGGDCPELSGRALLQAVGESLPFSTIYLFTDASAKDGFLRAVAKAAAIAKGIRVNYALTGTCSPVDPTYIDIAESTGGQVFFLNQFEIEKLFSLVEPTLSTDFVSLLLAKRDLASETVSFTVPVDSTISRLVFSVAVEHKTAVAVLRPDGTLIQSGAPGVNITELTTGWIITIEDPEDGQWTIQVTGDGDLSVAASANSAIQFHSFNFVEALNPIHTGYAPIPGEPVAGTPQTGLARLFGPFSTAEFSLVDSFGNQIKPVPMTQGDPNTAATDFSGVFTPPDASFRISVSGLDSTGQPYLRLFPVLFSVRTVAIRVDPTSLPTGLPSGQTTVIQFQVNNLGAAGVFSLAAADDRGFVSNVTPTQLSLGAGESGVVAVSLTVPAGTPDGTTVLLTATARSVLNPEVENSASVTLAVSGGNRAPMAKCQDQTVVTGSNCTATVSVDGGSFDEDGDAISLSQDPPGPYPLGTTVVTLTATDRQGASDACTASVTVIGVRCEKASVLAELVALGTIICDRNEDDQGRGRDDDDDDGGACSRVCDKLDDAIKHFGRSLNSELWIDETHPQHRHGSRVFHEERKAVEALEDLRNEGHRDDDDDDDDDGDHDDGNICSVPDSVLLGFIQRIVSADRLVAELAIQEAQAAGTKPKKIERARRSLARGDAATAKGEYSEAIDRYRQAWDEARPVRIHRMERLPGGDVHLEFIAFEPVAHTIQASSNAVNWTNIGRARPNSEGVGTFVDLNGGRYPTRFYRVLEP